jgi:hypothetical protein
MEAGDRASGGRPHARLRARVLLLRLVLRSGGEQGNGGDGDDDERLHGECLLG